MKATFLLFPHGEEEQELIDELDVRLRRIRPQLGVEGILLSLMAVPGLTGWPKSYRILTENIDPETVVQALYSTQWQREVRMVWRADVEENWSFLTLEYRSPVSEE